MTLYNVEFTYDLPETASIELEIDPTLSETEAEAFAIREIKEVYDDVFNIEIIKMKEQGIN